MHSISTEINEAMNKFMVSAKQSLAEIILSLQSDQLLKQMRNDQNLYNEKLNYIKELIKEHFYFQPIDSHLIGQINQLKSSKKQIESKMQESKEQYIAQLSNIEVHYKQFLLQKENQKKQMQTIIEDKNQELFDLNKNFTLKYKDLQIQSENFKRQLQISQSQSNQLKINFQLLQRSNQKLIQQIELLKKVQKQGTHQKLSEHSELLRKNTHLQKQITELLHQNKQIKEDLQTAEQKNTLLIESEDNYLETIQKMKEDMFLIKQQWQKKCLQIQTDLGQDYRKKIIQQEEEMNYKLKVYMQELKMGKTVIIQSSQQILQSKRVLMQHQFDQQIKQYTEQLKQSLNQLTLRQNIIRDLQAQLTQAQEKLALRETQVKQTKSHFEFELKKSEASWNKKQQELVLKLNNLKAENQKQIQRLRKTQNMFLKDLKTSKLQKEELQKDIQSIRDDFNQLKQSQIQQSKKYQQIEHLNQTSNTKILQLKKDLAIQIQKNTMDERSLKDKNNEILRLQNNLNQLRNQYKDLESTARKNDLKLAQYNLRHKQNQRTKTQMIHSVEKLFILVRKLGKDLCLIKQDIKFQINVHKSKMQALMLAINNQINLKEQNIKYAHKMKIKELLEQVQAEKKDQRDEMNLIIRENENMKKQIKLIQQIMKEKQEDYVYEKQRTINLEVQKCRLLMQEDIVKQREDKRKLEQKLYNQEKRYDYTIAKAQKEIFKHLKLFLSKWQNKIAESQQILQLKQKNIKQTNHHLKKALNQIETLKSDLEQKGNRLSKQQKKYEALKQERDKTIDEMMRRLEKQTKHKIALEKQMKEIRGEIIKTQANIISTPFNNYSFTDRQNTAVYTNAFQPTTHEKTKTQVKTNIREKELLQIREMIAKTYKVIEGAEKDSPVHKGKLF